ncbi:phosphoribulokinase/uridine kinase [Peziza echinospora]|nr:phosphoribulokinase/uridine kinase [Peziza echinospora]
MVKMEAQISNLVSIAIDLLDKTPQNERVLIGLCGIPGSGKTTLARRVVEGINEHYRTTTTTTTTSPTTPDIAVMIPMDGYHLPRSTLSLLPNPTDAHFRRGAPFTFDPTSLLKLLHSLHHLSPTTPTIHAPSFSHTLADPVPHSIPIHPTHRLLLFEGLYLSLNLPIWSDISREFNERWFLECPLEVARERLVRRHVKAGIVRGPEEARERVEGSDLVNARLVMGEGRVGGERSVAYLPHRSA